MRSSIKKQIAVIFILLFTAAIALSWLINRIFLETYYKANKTDVLEQIYKYINNSGNQNNIGSDEFEIQLDKLCENNNVALLIMNSSQAVQYASMNDPTVFRQLLFNYLFSKSESEYTIQETTDVRTGSDYMDMWGYLDNGDFFVMRSALESIRESVILSSRFMVYVGIAAILCSCFIILYVTDRIARPLLELVRISDRMIHLDFNAKYKSGGTNEIGLLGERMNILSETLEETISELKTANNELQKDIEKKDRIDEMRQEFLSNVSHELKTPIALIQGYAEGLKECVQDDAESRDFYCDVIMDESAKMNAMVKSLLTLNQLEFGNEKVTMERFDLTLLISNILQSTQILAGDKNVRVEFDESHHKFAWADEFKIEEVVTNYISNAFHYVCNENIIRVWMEEKGKNVRVYVYNSGFPIPDDELDKIWVKFYKVDKARTREYGGSGIGLSIVKAIMDSFNQKCGVENREDGVIFWFDIESAE